MKIKQKLMDKTLWECGTCHKKYNKRDIKRINKEIVCNHCKKERREKHREFLKRDILGIRKRSDLVKEWEEKRKLQGTIKKEGRLPPKIKGQRKTGRGSRNPYLGIYLTSVEKHIIYKKYAHLGSDFAKERLTKITDHFNQMITKKKEEGKTAEELNKTFKEEFAKLIMADEDGNNQ